MVSDARPGRVILHFTPRERWEAAVRSDTGEYRPERFAEEGFVHCSPAERIHLPANALARGEHGLVLLVIEVDRLRSEVVDEEPYPGAGVTFPHVYGPIDVEAVVDVVSFEPGDDGLFSLPPELHHLLPPA